MRRKEYEDLLFDVLGDATVEQFRQDSLSRSLHRLRRRKRIKTATQFCCIALLLVVPAWFIVQNNPREAQPSIPTNVPETASSAAGVQEPAPQRIQEITDTELLALFPERTVALIGPPGKQQLLVFGDGKAKAAGPLPYSDSQRRL